MFPLQRSGLKRTSFKTERVFLWTNVLGTRRKTKQGGCKRRLPNKSVHLFLTYLSHPAQSNLAVENAGRPSQPRRHSFDTTDASDTAATRYFEVYDRSDQSQNDPTRGPPCGLKQRLCCSRPRNSSSQAFIFQSRHLTS